MGNGFLKVLRGETWDLLEKHPDEFHLLLVIAKRARRTPTTIPVPLESGQALIGDWKSYGFSEQTYRRCKTNTQLWGLATYKPTPSGTIATLCCPGLFDINEIGTNEQTNTKPTGNQHPTNGQPNRQPTTNKKERRKEREECKKEILPPGVESEVPKPADSENGSDDLVEFEKLWSESFQEFNGRPYTMVWGADRAQSKKLLVEMQPKVAIEIAKKAWRLKDHPKAFYVARAQSIKSFCPNVNEIMAEVDRLEPKTNGYVKKINPVNGMEYVTRSDNP